ncbi:hypothetical protein IEZ26_22710 [Nocardioides cavernae]|uniref:DUF222 domain-containing protein n=1 Tax=Nocardioides cavernae TaxID=1921566 RepID=A0ABR8NH61_9ACTN|nr:hypothetical protein [Nocardioides cavernae]MBD3927452.1 hypothetical protein [Nocardioides cavernae]MBM7512943.1 hypothetical protein [Nocardioides cavernae]
MSEHRYAVAGLSELHSPSAKSTPGAGCYLGVPAGRHAGPMTTPGQPSSLDTIRSTFPELDAWGGRGSKVNTGAPGSELEADDAEYIAWQTSQLAAAGLMTARNHLHAIRVHIEAGEQFGDVTGSLIRGALLGSAQAVWILAPDDRATRLKRSRVVALEVCENHRKFLADLLRINPNDKNTKTVHDHNVDRLEKLEEKREELGETLTYSSTSIIEQAAAHAIGKGFETEARAEWRRFSGNAHGLPWALLGGAGTTQSAAASGGLAPFTAGGSFDDVINGYALVIRLVRHGWELFDRRAA